MSIRTNPMKAVPTLLKRLVTVEKQLKQVNLNDLKSELIRIKDLFSLVKKNEEELLDTLTVLDGYLRNKNINKLTEEEGHIRKRIRESTQKLLPAGEIQSTNIEDSQSSRKLPSSLQREELEMIEVNCNKLDHVGKRCLLSLLHFPENAVMKKSNIILWWVGVGLTANENGEDVFDKLMDNKIIVPHRSDKYPIENKFRINPCVHHIHKSGKLLLENDEKQPLQIITPSHHSDSGTYLALDKQKVKLSDQFGFKSNNCRSVFNVGASYLNFGPQWMAKMKHLEVLQLGRWLQGSPKHHIEVESEEFLKELRDQKELKYLSLRGISRISELPLSIFQLESLETLDLKACHNLETLPNDIASLRNLRHLDLSQCYLLDRMPKGIEKLAKLEVLKGFVIGSSIKTPCNVSDLAHLSKLKQLSIHIGSGAVIQDKEFESLEKLSELEKLKISWGVFDTRYSAIQVTLPSNLKKLHLEGFPGQNIPEWLKPDKISTSLCELSITGGRLKSMDLQQYAHVSCSLQIIRLKYLKHLKLD
ncbi:disease resistance RPP13-like protein 4 [Glycine soja]|uniref:Disease resistance RPP13-like protein 4 n=1 Tax=Glycine soja TaxID=3848 RepID=A0A0B2PVJ5_GLYSO|nr:disease resistance RPP13-like protein 4 [Glycine soja]KHN13180.1 Disease resistance RPP13-like protein 4 [Glycine soja]RZB51598.1 Disease resistance RPP13-like protein 4 [Glycine soja]